MKDYDLIIITSYSFPIGLASTNRITTYAKAIAKTHRVLLLSYADSSYITNGETYVKGSYDGIDYLYLRPRDPKKKTLLSKISYRIITYLRFIYLLLFEYKTQSIISYFDSISYTRLLYGISRIRSIPIYRDITETYELYFKTKKERNRHKRIQSLYDGLIVLTEGIRDYFIGINDNTFLLPMGVDIARFEAITPVDNKYFFYCSGGVLERDGVLDAINGFLLFHSKNNNYKFKMATPINRDDEYHNKVLTLIRENPCLEYLGVVNSDVIPGLMMSATGLTVTPHYDYITKGFPTKLGEYLASGKPVICTSIPSLKNSVPIDCCIMVEPNHPEQVAEAMSYIASHAEESKQIGERGRSFVESKYTVEPYLKDLKNFIQI